MKNQRGIEELLSDLLRTQDKQNDILIQHTEILSKILNTQEGQAVYNKLNNELLAMIGDKIDRNNDARKEDFAKVNTEVARVNTKLDILINEFRTIKPLIEKALDLDERVRKIEEHIFRKGA